MRRYVWALGVVAAVVSSACGDDETQLAGGSDADGDGWLSPADCDDHESAVFPGADEVPYDGVDQDCSGSDLTDVDGDGVDGAPEAGAAGGAAGASGDDKGPRDCDDSRPDVNPAAVDVCGDGVDQDCSGSDQPCSSVDRDGDGASPDQGDCNDGNAAIGPDQPEIYYNGVDDNCDPNTDDGDQDGDGFSRTAGGDCDDADASIFPGAEEIPYDDIDQNCSGADEVDVDGDGVAGGVDGADCDDFDASVYSGRDELVGDAIDQNCDGSDLAGLDDFKGFTEAPAMPASGGAIASGEDGEGDPIALVAWPDSRNSAMQDVYAQLLDEAGEPVGAEIQVVEGGLSKADVRVAARDSVFLVTWRTSDGIFGQLISGEGDHIANGLPIGAAGGAATEVSYGPDNFAVAWRQTDADPVEVHVRGVTVEGVRGDNNVVFAGPSGDVALASTPSEHVVFWTGEGGHGLFAHRVNGRGEPVGDVLEITDQGPFGPISATASGNQFALALQQTGPTQSVRGMIVDVAGNIVAGGESGFRLSRESLSVPDVRIAATDDGYFVAWQDLRHVTATPSLQAIYRNGFETDGSVHFLNDRALYTDAVAELGGAAYVGSDLLVVARSWRGLGVFVVTD